MQLNCQAGQCDYVFGPGWGYSQDIGVIISRIHAEQSQEPTPYGPTILAKGHTKLEFANPTNSDMFIELVKCKLNYTRSSFNASDIANWFSAAWSFSLASRQSGFEYFPTTHIKQNWAFFDPRYAAVRRCGTRRFKVSATSVRTIIDKCRAVFSYIDYFTSGGVGGVCYANKSVFYIIRVRFATGIVQGVSSYSGANPPVGGVYPIISAVGGDWAIKTTSYYSYRWVPGNTSSNQFGSWLAQYADTTYPGTETVSPTTMGWAPDRKNRILRPIYTRDTAVGPPNDYTFWGPFQRVTGAGSGAVEVPTNTTLWTNINPVADAAGDAFKPGVSTT